MGVTLIKLLRVKYDKMTEYIYSDELDYDTIADRLYKTTCLHIESVDIVKTDVSIEEIQINFRRYNTKENVYGIVYFK